MKSILNKAINGNASAQLKVALHYIWGSDGFRKSERLARIWYKKSAINGNAEAMFNLGTMCLEGDGGKVDTNAGIQWLKKSAQSKKKHLFSSGAPSLLSTIYRNGLFGVEVDMIESKKWKKLSHQRKDG